MRASDASETAQAFLRSSRKQEAELWFREALAGDPSDVLAVAGLVRLLLERRAFGEAVRILEAGIRRHPFSLALCAEQRTLGLALYSAGFWEEAEPWLLRASEKEPWDPVLKDACSRARRPPYLGADVLDETTGARLRRYAAREGASYIYVIDVVGLCSLRCPTCPVGNSELGDRPRGLMKYELFERIVQKIRRESPCEQALVNLFNWGEPLLHPELPRMIGLLRQSGLRSCVSTTLNIRRGLESVIAASPCELKISLSGFTESTYERTHPGGKLELVKENMRKVREYIDHYQTKTHVWVSHHLYRSNQAQAPLVKQFCEDLKFEYRPIMAYYMPLERLVDHLNGKPNVLDQNIIDDLLYSPIERSRASAQVRSGHFDCELRFNQTVINHDGTVALCCAVYDQENMLGVRFLEADFHEIEKKKYAHSYCRTCYGHHLQYAPNELALLPE
jgi:MoaA/NifB/PqqE/SkfB family radical SAM enzyme